MSFTIFGLAVQLQTRKGELEKSVLAQMLFSVLYLVMAMNRGSKIIIKF